jgi:hypothetical protein
MKMETTHVSETSTLYNHTPGNYPKEDNIRFSQLGESLKTRFRLRVFENRVLRRLRVFWSKMNEITGKVRKLHKEWLNNLLPSTNIVRVTKSRRMRWAGHVA